MTTNYRGALLIVRLHLKNGLLYHKVLRKSQKVCLHNEIILYLGVALHTFISFNQKAHLPSKYETRVKRIKISTF